MTGTYFPEIGSGGLQCQAVARCLGGRVGFAVLTTATDPALPAHETVDGVRVSRIHVDVTSRASTALASARILPELLRLVRRVDVVHVHGFSRKNLPVAAAAKLFRRPLVLSLHTARHDEPEMVAAQWCLAWWAYSSADLYLSVSPGLIERYLAAGFSPDRIRRAPNGVDVERFAPATMEERTALRRRLGLPLDRPLVLFVGIFSHDKQPRVLFDAWLGLQQHASLAPALVFVGATSPRQFEADAQLAADIRAAADRAGYGERMVFVEPTHAVHEYYRAANVFVLPSAREGLPVALLEAMACGLPCIASRLPGATDAIIEHDVNGRLVPPGDVEALANALSAVLEAPDAAWRLGAAARRTVEERYRVTQAAEHWLAAYRHVLGRS